MLDSSRDGNLCNGKLVIPVQEIFGERRVLIRATSLFVVIAITKLCAGAPPADPLLEVRLQSHLTSYSNPSGSTFHCVVIRALEVDGRILIPQGSLVYGRVRRQLPVGLGLVRDRARLELEFD